MDGPGPTRVLETPASAPDGRPDSSGPLLRVENLHKVFRSGAIQVHCLSGIDLEVGSGEMVAVIGPSGAGKSTLLHLLAALDTPTTGTVYFAGESLNAISAAQLADFRNRRVGFVWQRHHLLTDFSAAENVAIPLWMRGVARDSALRSARSWLAKVGLAERAAQAAAQLSGGEQQRVAIARALVTEPVLLLADEPTGDLDEQNAEAIFDLMQSLHRSLRLTSIVATHNLALARRCDRVLRLEHGILQPVSLAAPAGVQENVPLARDAGERHV